MGYTKRQPKCISIPTAGWDGYAQLHTNAINNRIIFILTSCQDPDIL